MRDAVDRVLNAYPRVYFACHARRVPDPATRRVLSRHQASILDHLHEVEATTLTDLAAHMGVTPGTMSLAVERLVRRGYVQRARDAADRRRLRLRLSASGARVKQAASILDPARVEAVLKRLSNTEREAALAGLEALARAAADEMRQAGRQAHARRPEVGERSET